MDAALLPPTGVDGEQALDGSSVYGKPASGKSRRCEWIYDLVPQNETEHRVHVAAMFVRDALSVRSIDHRTDRWSVAIYSMCVAREAAPDIKPCMLLRARPTPRSRSTFPRVRRCRRLVGFATHYTTPPARYSPHRFNPAPLRGAVAVARADNMQ